MFIHYNIYNYLLCKDPNHTKRKLVNKLVVSEVVTEGVSVRFESILQVIQFICEFVIGGGVT